jgi:5S rRNA maturation endonuclease (ribonuclease M5)
MYGFSDVYKDLSVINILNSVPESMLWRHYLGHDFEVNKCFNAPYRRDREPSFGIHYDSRNRLMFNDYGRPGVYGDIFNFLQLTLGLTFTDSLRKINTDFDLGLGDLSDQQFGKRLAKQDVKELEKFQKTFVKKNPVHYRCHIRRYEEEDFKYWMQYGIDKDTLAKYHVYCLSKLIRSGYQVYTYTKDNPGYVYAFPKTKHIKAYFPLSEINRFQGNVNNFEDIQGYYQCRVKETYPNKVLVLTKSLKDCMVFHKFGIDAMAIHGEGHFFNEDFIRHIKKYYPKVISLYDPDKSGMLGAKALWKKHNIAPYFISRGYRSNGCKDISDLYKEYGEEDVRRFIEGELGLSLEF